MSLLSTIQKPLQKASARKRVRHPSLGSLIFLSICCAMIFECRPSKAQNQREARREARQANSLRDPLIMTLPPLQELPAHQPRPAETEVKKIVSRLQADTKTYDAPTDQDCIGFGILPPGSQRFSDGADQRSEPIYPSFVLGPRRQTDSLVRQAIRLLPDHLAQNTSFVLPDRILQRPEAYLASLRQKPYAVVFGSFVGIGSSPDYPAWAERQHQKELQALRDTLGLLKALDRKILLVSYAMGDSISEQALPVRGALEKQKNALLAEMGLAELTNNLTWGADELPFVAFARLLPSLKVTVKISNPQARQHYDGKRTAEEVVREKLATLGLEIVPDGQPAHARVLVMTRRPEGNEDTFQANDAAQREFDTRFIRENWGNDEALVSRTALVDMRIFNGAWDAEGLPRTCSGLAFGAWGTASNALGSTVGLAKILLYANNPTAQKQLWLEAFAHDVFANGYAESQRGIFRERLQTEAGIDFQHYSGYATAQTTATVFLLLNDHVNGRMQRFFADSGCTKGLKFKLTPQLWRTFESEIHLWPQEKRSVFEPGIFRHAAAPLSGVFSPLTYP